MEKLIHSALLYGIVKSWLFWQYTTRTKPTSTTRPTGWIHTTAPNFETPDAHNLGKINLITLVHTGPR